MTAWNDYGLNEDVHYLAEHAFSVIAAEFTILSCLDVDPRLIIESAFKECSHLYRTGGL